MVMYLFGLRLKVKTIYQTRMNKILRDAMQKELKALLQITMNGKLKTILAKGVAYEFFPWLVF
jgi:hypothetical protein